MLRRCTAAAAGACARARSQALAVATTRVPAAQVAPVRGVAAAVVRAFESLAVDARAWQTRGSDGAAGVLPPLARSFAAGTGDGKAEAEAEAKAESEVVEQQAEQPKASVGDDVDYEIVNANPLSGAVAGRAGSGDGGAPGAAVGVRGAAVREFRVRRRNQKHSPKKLNQLAKLIRGMSMRDAVLQCQLSPKKAAKIMLKVLDNAAYIAHKNYSLDPSRLRVKICDIGKGSAAPNKRIAYHARGRAGLIVKSSAHVNMVVEHVPKGEPLHHVTRVTKRWGAERNTGFRTGHRRT